MLSPDKEGGLLRVCIKTLFFFNKLVFRWSSHVMFSWIFSKFFNPWEITFFCWESQEFFWWGKFWPLELIHPFEIFQKGSWKESWNVRVLLKWAKVAFVLFQCFLSLIQLSSWFFMRFEQPRTSSIYHPCKVPNLKLIFNENFWWNSTQGTSLFKFLLKVLSKNLWRKIWFKIKQEPLQFFTPTKVSTSKFIFYEVSTKNRDEKFDSNWNRNLLNLHPLKGSDLRSI